MGIEGGRTRRLPDDGELLRRDRLINTLISYICTCTCMNTCICNANIYIREYIYLERNVCVFTYVCVYMYEHTRRTSLRASRWWSTATPGSTNDSIYMCLHVCIHIYTCRQQEQVNCYAGDRLISPFICVCIYVYIYESTGGRARGPPDAGHMLHRGRLIVSVHICMHVWCACMICISVQGGRARVLWDGLTPGIDWFVHSYVHACIYVCIYAMHAYTRRTSSKATGYPWTLNPGCVG